MEPNNGGQQDNQQVEDQTARALEVQGLKKYYGTIKAVDGVSFYVKEGQVFTLLGPNGAGKTTIVEILEGLKEADEGQLFFFGQKCAQIGKKEKEQIGVLLQENNFIDRIKVKEIVNMFAAFFKKAVPTKEILQRVVLEEKENSFVEDLSGGQKQRLAIGLALINDPRILFLDEPTTGLDPQARRNVWDLIKELKNEGKTIFLTTHYMEEAEELSDYVYIMDRGHIIARGTSGELIGKLGQENVIDFTRNNLSPDTVSEVEDMFAETVISSEQISIYVDNLTRDMSSLLSWAEKKEIQLDNLMIRRPNLEDVFLELTGKELRE